MVFAVTMELEIIEMERGTMMMERMTITMMMEKMTITMMMERMTMMMEKMTMMMERMTMAPGDCRNVGKGSSTLMISTPTHLPPTSVKFQN